MIDEKRIEQALRGGPPFRTRYVQRPLPLGSEAGPGGSRLLALVAVTVLLAVLLGGAALVGSGVIDYPVPPVVPGGSAAPSAAPAPGGESTWTATGSMSTAVPGPMVPLADGRILIVGGLDSTGIGLSAGELYDPRSGSWTAAADMIEDRVLHTATLLPDGTVLVAGGQSRSGISTPGLASAELYDPRSGSWTATGDMTNARAGHTATLLPDGTVLVTGGWELYGRDLVSTEVYDPRTGSWTASGGMTAGRSGHTATLLEDGRVLVTGGGNGARVAANLSSAELYDPSTRSWTATGGMIEGRSAHTATLLPDGTVLVAGSNNFGVLDSAELYDPATGSWTATGTMIEGRGSHSATLLPDGSVLVAGGANGGGDGAVTSTAELYDPRTGSWTATGSLALPRKFHSASLLSDGRVLVAGGNDGIVSERWHWLATAELYGPVGGY